MSTRANVKIVDSHDTLWFYRHSDGMPKWTLPSLIDFMRPVVTGERRDNTTQAAGWLVIIGHQEHGKMDLPEDYYGWKVGAFEPTTDRHGDIEYLYVCDLEKKTITVYSSAFDGKEEDDTQLGVVTFNKKGHAQKKGVALKREL